jgi:hypothetical protein
MAYLTGVRAQMSHAATEPRGYLIDGSGPTGTNIECSIKLQAPQGERIALKFETFNLDPLTGPWTQPSNLPSEVRIYDGDSDSDPEITWLSGLDLDSSSWVSRTSSMYITFSSGFQATVHEFSALWVFSGSGAPCSLQQAGDLLQQLGDGSLPQLPAHANLGSCADADVVGRSDGLMDSGRSCSLGCDAGWGIQTDLSDRHDDDGDVAPTYGILKDMLVCFDGTLELHPFTCEKQNAHKENICQPSFGVLSEPTGKLTDGSGGASGTDGQVFSNSDCGVLLQAPVGQQVAVKFNAFDVASTDRVTLHDGEDSNGPVIAVLYGDFTCSEDTTDCDDQTTRHEIEGGQALSAIMVGGYGSSGRSMFVHFKTRRKPHEMQALGAEGFTLQWMHSGVADPCSLLQRPFVRAPAFGDVGTCDTQRYPSGLRTGESCDLVCDAGLQSSANADPDTWRTIHYIGPSISEQPMCWNGRMINLGQITCLQTDTCVNWNMSPVTVAGACEVLPNYAPYPGKTGTWGDCTTSGCNVESSQGLGADTWYRLAVVSGKSYTVSTRLGSATFTWLYIYESDPSQSTGVGTQLASCINCRPDSGDLSSTLSWTADSTRTVIIKVHTTAFSSTGFTLTVDCEDCAPPAPPPGVDTGTCVPLPDPDGAAGGVDTSQCRGVHFGKACTVTCDADRLYSGDPADFQCDTSGTTLGQWTALDGGFPTCSRTQTGGGTNPVDPGWTPGGGDAGGGGH